MTQRSPSCGCALSPSLSGPSDRIFSHHLLVILGGLPCSDPLIVESQILNVGMTVNFQFLTHTTLPITIQNAIAITAMGRSWYLLFNFAKMISIWSSNFAILIIFGTEVSNFALYKIFSNLSFQNSKWIGTWTTLPSWWQVPELGCW